MENNSSRGINEAYSLINDAITHVKGQPNFAQFNSWLAPLLNTLEDAKNKLQAQGASIEQATKPVVEKQKEQQGPMGNVYAVGQEPSARAVPDKSSYAHSQDTLHGQQKKTG